MELQAGVVAVQGNVSEHAEAVKQAAKQNGHTITVETIRTSGIIPECDLLLIPGGESTTISRLIHREGLAEEIKQHVADGKPVLATCAGLIVLAADPNDERVDSLGLVDVSVERNAFGRQKDSFEAALDIDGLDEPFHAVFIRAPVVANVGDGIDVLAQVNDTPVAVQDGPVIATSFHPELTDDSRIHNLAFFGTDK
ncbi:pyridoxal 5'-phosphate synthase glutaminase subunit PdxT [Salinarchaeum sp. IM2453]|uniref:pyridoxal 5'-phosphate synthase glutaminase subunit PdxT n=1 Tax=Salinarchaeum sp. IM2453 TaxID=2862870 RepID=UPI001C82AC7A|nr:pyridoxal 5'-phosphate synthase glutaminase subunit PdxT [Salinarchaeum sp. IM2453]QZA89601.1 pyridoxal 5'-phosphate synthase glutaminase subunit PdxT [Salinarchaeum sp. IM2453]